MTCALTLPGTQQCRHCTPCTAPVVFLTKEQVEAERARSPEAMGKQWGIQFRVEPGALAPKKNRR